MRVLLAYSLIIPCTDECILTGQLTFQEFEALDLDDPSLPSRDPPALIRAREKEAASSGIAAKGGSVRDTMLQLASVDTSGVQVNVDPAMQQEINAVAQIVDRAMVASPRGAAAAASAGAFA